jgi:ankyrin repeat protein
MTRGTALLIFALCASGCGLLSAMLVDDLHAGLVGAARRGDVATLTRLAAEGLDLDQPEGDHHWTPLQHAVHKEQAASVRVLLEWGASPDATQPGNGTPLFMAADSKDPAMVELLINAGADVEWEGSGGRTPLTQAVSAGAPWDLADRPLLGGCHTETVRAFMKAYPKLRMPRTGAGKTAEMWARAHDCPEVLQLIDVAANLPGQRAIAAAGLIRDWLGVPRPRDVFQRKPAMPAPSRP